MAERSGVTRFPAEHLGASDVRFVDSHRFLHERVARYLMTLAAFFAFFTVMGWLKLWLLRGYFPASAVAAMTSGVTTLTVVSALLGLGWLLLRRKLLSAGLLRAAEIIGTLLCVFSIVHILMLMPDDLRGSAPPELGLLLLAVLVLVLRAALVPSGALGTLLVGLLVSAELSAVAFMNLDASGVVHAVPGGSELPINQIWMFVLTWGLIFTAATVIVSHVIYGLHERVRRAIRLGNYTLSAKLGEGGMGEVYLAHHALLRRPTAIKLLPPESAGETTIKRFEREVLEASRLTHPNIVEVYDFGRTPDGVFYYAMEYLDGLDLEELVAQYGPLSPGRVVYVLAQVAHALEHAHTQRLIHRDIKPANIVLCDRGGVADMAKVVDFGLVKPIETPNDPALTGSNTVTGTPAYMAPESLTSPDEVDGRTDLYALGAVGYYMLTGETVFSGNTVVEICGHHLHSEPESPSRRLGKALPRDLEQVLLRCLRKKPEERYKSGAELRDALLACEVASAWSLNDGARWWEAHRGEVRDYNDNKQVDVSRADTMLIARLSA